MLAVAAIGIVLFFYVGFYCYKAYGLAYENCHPKRAAVAEPEGIPYGQSKFSFVSKGGAVLSAVEWLPNKEIKGTVIACHYLGGSKNAIYPYVEPLLKEGFRVTAFDYPNHGESMDQKGLKYDLEEDMQLFLSRLKERGINGPYGVMGLSMGASLALSAAGLCDEIRVVIVDSGPLIFVREYVDYVLRTKHIKHPIEKWAFTFLSLYVVGFQKMSRKLLRRIEHYKNLPILMIHGKKDHTISPENTAYLYKQLNTEGARRIVVEGAHHLTNRILLGTKYDEMIVDFVKKNLGERTYEEGQNSKNSAG